MAKKPVESAVAVAEPTDAVPVEVEEKKPRTLEEAMKALEEKKNADEAQLRKEYREWVLKENLSDDEQFQFIALMKTLNKSLDDVERDRQVLKQFERLQNEISAKPHAVLVQEWREARKAHEALQDKLKLLNEEIRAADIKQLSLRHKADRCDSAMVELSKLSSKHPNLFA
jgi:hypothetical protein